MAATAVVNTKMTKNTPVALPATAAINSTDGAYIKCDAGQKMLIILEATAAGTITVKGGDSYSPATDLVVTFGAAGTQVLNIDTVGYQITAGEHKGEIHITGTGKVACVVLP